MSADHPGKAGQAVSTARCSPRSSSCPSSRSVIAGSRPSSSAGPPPRWRTVPAAAKWSRRGASTRRSPARGWFRLHRRRRRRCIGAPGRALALHRARDPRQARGAGGFRLRHPGARQRAGAARRLRGAEAGASSRRDRRPAHPRLRADRGGGRLRRGRHPGDRGAPGRRLRPERRQDVDFQCRARRRLRRLRAHRRGAGLARHLRVPRRRRNAGLSRDRAGGGDRPARHRRAGVPRLPYSRPPI